MAHSRSCALLWLATLTSCNAVLGVESLKTSPDAGSENEQGGSGGDAKSAAGGGGGGNAGSQDAPRAGQGGAAGSRQESGRGGGGAPASGTGGAHAGSGGAAGQAGTDDHAAGRGGTGGTGGTSGANTVHGRVVDYYQHGVPNAQIRSGDKTTQTSDDGHFTLEGLGASYDVVVGISTSIQNVAARIVWQVEGLTRRDPTIQVYRGLGGRSATTLIMANNVTFPLTSTQEARMTWISPDGSFAIDLTSASTNYLSPTWVGPASSVGTAHAVLLEVGGSPALPVSYTAHDAHAVTLQDNATDVPINFDLASQQLTTGALGGSVTGPSNNRENRVYMRFADNAALLLASEFNPASANFSYVVPNVPSATFTVTAEDQNNGLDQGLTAAYADNLTAGQTGIALSLPSIPVLNAPAAGKANVDGTTQFQWSSSAKVFLFCAFSNDNYDRMCVLTTKKEAKLPVAPLSDFTPAANSSYGWAIEVHGDFADVDAATSDAGYLSPYALGEIRGPKRGSGAYAESAHSGFTTAP